MDRERMERRWAQLAAEAFTGVADWRAQHPTATFWEIEAAGRCAPGGGAGPDAGGRGSGQPGHRRKRMPVPGVRPALDEGRGRHRRSLLTTHQQQVTLVRHYGQCPACGAGHFPPG